MTGLCRPEEKERDAKAKILNVPQAMAITLIRNRAAVFIRSN